MRYQQRIQIDSETPEGIGKALKFIQDMTVNGIRTGRNEMPGQFIFSFETFDSVSQPQIGNYVDTTLYPKERALRDEEVNYETTEPTGYQSPPYAPEDDPLVQVYTRFKAQMQQRKGTTNE